MTPSARHVETAREIASTWHQLDQDEHVEGCFGCRIESIIACALDDEQERAAKRVSAVTERVDEPWVEMRARIVALIRGDGV